MSDSTMDRRRFLTTAALGGATIVGASALGALDADAAFATTWSTLDPAIATSVFAEGRIGAIKNGLCTWPAPGARPTACS